MSEQTTVFKVVRNLGGVHVSAIQGPVVLAYRIGIPTEACDALPEAGPLAFDGFKAALSFAKFEAKLAHMYNKPANFEIYEAIGEDVQPVDVLSREMTVDDRRAFWLAPHEFTGTSVYAAPKGTVVTSSLTLVRKVWDQENGEVQV